MKPTIKENAPTDLTIITLKDPLYHYARVISNTRFGHMPSAIAYCENVDHISYCINYCIENNADFRVRSGGHQHEGMSSGNGVVIIDLSKMNTIEYINNKKEAWIPVGKQLGKVYKELEEFDLIIPGGGCQSVNVGGLTQGGGWGMSVRKHGMTCDSVVACEIVLANGDVVVATATNELSDLFKALKGGGGGNFGIVTRFLFRLTSLLPVTTSFALRWEKADDVISVMKLWTVLHAKMDAIDPALSTACGMLVAEPKKGETKGTVHLRMGGLFYGSKTKLLGLLNTYFKGYIPEKFVSLVERPENYSENQKKAFKSENIENRSRSMVSLASHQSFISDFVNPTVTITDLIEDESSTCGNRKLRILPNSPGSTCDKPHPHKVTSSFPNVSTLKDHEDLVQKIYDHLAGTCFYKDVNRYMSFHCLGGAVTQNTDKRFFAYHDKPYMFQIQAWWDDAGNPFTNESRNKEYVAWVKEFREKISKETEGAFINFVDSSLVSNIEKDENRIKLLEIYYGKENLRTLQHTKFLYDPTQVFKFEMSILPENIVDEL